MFRFPVRGLAAALVLGWCLSIQSTWAQSVAEPTFSRASGFYTHAFDLQISASDDAVVYVTLDGTEPTELSAMVDGPLRIDRRTGEPGNLASIPTARDYFHADPPATVPRATIVRARAISPEGASSVVTHAYFVGDVLPPSSLPVISLVVDSTGFFGYDEGIYVPGRIYDEMLDEDQWIGHRPANYNQRGAEWERDVHIQFFQPGGTLDFEQNAGVRTHGGATRAMRLKSLRLYARSAYGDENRFEHPFFGDPENTGQRRLVLRNSGQDFDWTMFRDALQHRLVRHLNFETQEYRPAQVFLNGEYWGIHNIRERSDDHELVRRYGAHRDDIVILENNAVVDTGIEGDDRHYLEVRDYLLNNELDEIAMALVEQRIDLSSFIDYHVVQIFLNNGDWPGNNVRFWRVRGGNPEADVPELDGRWRWIFFDLDDGMLGDPSENKLAHATEEGNESWPNPDWSTIMLRRLLTHDGFRAQFIHRFSDLMNTVFRAVHIDSVVDGMSDTLRPAMTTHLARWQPYQTLSTWEAHVQTIRNFAWARPAHVRMHLKESFDLGDEALLSVDVPSGGGRIRVNHETIDQNTVGLRDSSAPSKWFGYYFRDVPLRLTALPDNGYRFDGWIVNGENHGDDVDLDLVLRGETHIEAIYVPRVIDAMKPEPHRLSEGRFEFSYWSADEPEGSFPFHMGFQQADMDDPRLDDEMTGPYHVPHDDYAAADAGTTGFPYNNTTRTRINGLGSDGISFINTGRGRDLGAAIVALDTRDVDAARVTWTGGTVLANSRVYHIRLQYRVGEDGPFHDVMVGSKPVEYRRRNENGHTEVIGPVALPEEALGEEYVQLRWKYYFTGERLNPNVGQRDELRLGDIRIEMGEVVEATRLVFGMELIGGQPGRLLKPFDVYAVDDAGRVDATFGSEISISLEGAADLAGETIRTADRGAATFSALTADGPAGAYVLSASTPGLASASAPLRLIHVEEVVMPAYIQGAHPENLDRVPFAYRVRLEGLDTLATYRFGNRVVAIDDPPDQDGAGNMLLRLPGGTFARNTDSPRFLDSDYGQRHSTFETDESGAYTGWFVTEPSGNARFTPGEEVSMLVILNDGNGGETPVYHLRTDNPVRVIEFSTEREGGTGLYTSSHRPAGEVIVVYDGDGRALAAAPVESIGADLDDRFAGFYVEQVQGRDGNSGMIIPNDLEEGVVYVEWLLWQGEQTVATASSLNGWFGQIDTRSMYGGLRNPVSLVFREDVPEPALPTQFAINTSVEPEMLWRQAPEGGPYVVEMALFSDFVTPIHVSEALSDTTWTAPPLDEYTEYVWRVGRLDGEQIRWSSTSTFETGRAVGGELPGSPPDYSLHPPYPNPFTEAATVVFDLPVSTDIRLTAYDMLGRRVLVLADGMRPAGRHTLVLRADELPSGTYLVRMESDSHVETRTIVLLR